MQQETTGEYWQSIVESICDGFWVLNCQWCCTYINYRQAELIGMPKVDGYRLMRQARRLPPQQGGLIQAIALTAYAEELSKQ